MSAVKFGPFRLGRPFYAERSPRVSGLKLFGFWVYSRVGSVSRFCLCGLVRWRVGRSITWRVFPTNGTGARPTCALGWDHKGECRLKDSPPTYARAGRGKGESSSTIVVGK